MWTDIPLFPEQASSMAERVDALYLFLVGVTIFFSLLISIAIVYFAIRYRRSRSPRPKQIESSLLLEVLWSAIPLAIAMVMFVWGAILFFGLQRSPRGAEEIYVVAKQWMWKFQHKGGQREINTLHVPVGRDIKMIMTSQDVIHSFFVPAFRVKQDVLPGRYTSVWFRATKPGSYHLFCTEYCGTQHSGMIGQVVVLEPAVYQAWLSGGAAEGSLASSGERLFQDLACNTCHRPDTEARGPDLTGIFGATVRLQDGSTTAADESYIRESIVNPQAKIVAGFQPIMPTFQGQVSEEGLLQLVAYIKSLQAKPESELPATGPPTPQAIEPRQQRNH